MKREGVGETRGKRRTRAVNVALELGKEWNNEGGIKEEEEEAKGGKGKEGGRSIPLPSIDSISREINSA